MVVQKNVFHNVFVVKLSNPSGSKTVVSRKTNSTQLGGVQTPKPCGSKTLLSKQIPKSKLVG